MYARGICQNYGMEILSMENQKEYEEFMRLFYMKHNKLVDVWYATGAISTTPGSLNDWHWVTTGKLIDYRINWDAGQPNGGVERCLWLHKAHNSIDFHDDNCENAGAHNFICQLESPNYMNGWFSWI